jgi:multidrug resistance efflux pump
MMHKRINGIKKNTNNEIEVSTTVVYNSEQDLRNLRNYAEQRLISLEERLKQTQEQIEHARKELDDFELALQAYKASNPNSII